MKRAARWGLGLALMLSPYLAARAAASSSDPVKVAARRAAAFWSGVPCDGEVAVVGGSALEAPISGANTIGPARPAAMWATWLRPAGETPLALAGSPDAIDPATFTDCVVHINLSVWPSWKVEDRHFAAFCKEMLHEFGHFDGESDVGQPRGTIEYERPDLAREPVCERYRLRFGPRVYAGRARRRSRRSHR